MIDDELAARMMKLFGDAPMGCVYTDAEPMEDPGELADLLLLTR